MKLPVILCIVYFSSAEENGDDISITLHDVVGNAKSGILPRALAPPGPDDMEESESLRTIVDLLKRMAGVGVQDVPVFDPYDAGSLDPINLFGILGVSGTMYISNLVIDGLQKYEHPTLLVQANNLTIDGAKLVTFEETFPKLDFTANLKTEITYLNIKNDIITCKVQGTAHDIRNNGSLGFDRTLVPSDLIGHLVMNVDSFDIQNLIKTLELNFMNVKILSGRSRSSDISQSDLVTILADKISMAVAQAVKKQLNSILNGFRADQVEAYLLPRMVDEET